MRKRFTLLDIGPLSVNATYIRGHNGVTKSTEARRWTQEVCHNFNNDVDAASFKALREYLNPKLHSVSVTIWCVYPEAELLTKQGTVSARTQDCSNFEKSIIDVMFLPKFFSEPSPHGVQNLNCDDKVITELRSFKARSVNGRRGMVVDIEIKPIEKVQSLDLSIVPEEPETLHLPHSLVLDSQK